MSAMEPVQETEPPAILLILKCNECPNTGKLYGLDRTQVLRELSACAWQVVYNAKTKRLVCVCPDCVLKRLLDLSNGESIPLFPVD